MEYAMRKLALARCFDEGPHIPSTMPATRTKGERACTYVPRIPLKITPARQHVFYDGVPDCMVQSSMYLIVWHDVT